MAKEEDFILTISDNDDLSIEEEPEPEFSAPNETNVKKRKRTAEPIESQSKKKSPWSESHKHKKLRATVKLATEGTSGSEDDSEDPGEQDGAIDPDFIFELDGNDSLGVVEDFDGWDAEAGPAVNGEEAKKGNKKGVDIDEIITRRAGKKVRSDQESAIQDELHESDSGSSLAKDLDTEKALEEGVSGDHDEREGGDWFPTFDDDELVDGDGFGAGAASDEEAAGEESDGNNEADSALLRNWAPFDLQESDGDSVASPTAHPDDLVSDHASEPSVTDQDEEEAEKRAAFFAPEERSPAVSGKSSTTNTNSFQLFSLSRPLLRGIATISFTTPTPIQKRTIPVALAGKDVVGSAVTGSGKTAAFLLPILERLLYRPRKVPTTRVAILLPTRELAVQCYNVAVQLAGYTDITFVQLVGGFNLREQEALLKKRPDVVIATPGRFIDHMRNSPSFSVETLEILVLDEADRMLEDGFADELDEILRTIPKGRQTMLFSATMTDRVDKLVRIGMNRPVRVSVDAKSATVEGLVQEFVRLKPGREDKRLASLLVLCTKYYAERTLIFFRQKKEVHRVRVIFGLLGINAGELHGGMTQEQRINAVSSFRSGQKSHLLATDLASRGLDIKNIMTVINYEAPQTHEIYLHRVGRTARAGRSGRACTIAAEPDRKVVKAAVKSGRAHGAKIVSRVLDLAEVDAMEEKITALSEEVEEILQEEKEEKQLAQADMQLTKGENLVKHESEIMARPKRTWFESEQEKRAAKKSGRVELNGPDVVQGQKKKSKLSGKDKKRLDDRRERLEGKVWRKGKGSEEAVKEEKRERQKGKRMKAAPGSASGRGKKVNVKGKAKRRS